MAQRNEEVDLLLIISKTGFNQFLIKSTHSQCVSSRIIYVHARIHNRGSSPLEKQALDGSKEKLFFTMRKFLRNLHKRIIISYIYVTTLQVTPIDHK